MKSDIMIKYEADSKTTPQNIRDIERYLVGGVRRYNNPVKTEDIIKKYHLELDEIVPSSSTGDSETVYEILCKNFTQANAYHDFMEIYEAMKNKEPLRTELLPEKKTRSYKNCKAKFHEGEEVYCVELVENIYKAFRAKVIGYRIIKLSDGNFDIEYDLKAPCYGLGIGNKLQRNGTIFRTKSEAEQKAVERNLAMGWVAQSAMGGDSGFLVGEDLREGMELWVMYVEPDNTFCLGNVFLPMRIIREYPKFWLCEVLPHRNPEGFGISKVFNMTLCKHGISAKEIIIRRMIK